MEKCREIIGSISQNWPNSFVVFFSFFFLLIAKTEQILGKISTHCTFLLLPIVCVLALTSKMQGPQCTKIETNLKLFDPGLFQSCPYKLLPSLGDYCYACFLFFSLQYFCFHSHRRGENKNEMSGIISF